MKRLASLALLCLAFIRSSGQETSAELPEEPIFQSVLSGAQNPSATTATQEYSSEKISIRKFDEKKWHDIVGARSYADNRTRNTPQNERSSGEQGRPSSGTRATENDKDDARYSYDDDSETIDMSWLGPVGEIIFYGAVAAIVIVILVQVVRTNSFKRNPKRTRGLQQNADDIHDITILDTDDLIMKAHSARDYKLAIRLYFLDLLKKLNEHGMITWTRDKTNRDYLGELFSKQYYFEEIRHLTTAYERVWYGEHFPTEDGYNKLRVEFQAINQKFKTA